MLSATDRPLEAIRLLCVLLAVTSFAADSPVQTFDECDLEP